MTFTDPLMLEALKRLPCLPLSSKCSFSSFKQRVLVW